LIRKLQMIGFTISLIIIYVIVGCEVFEQIAPNDPEAYQIYQDNLERAKGRADAIKRIQQESLE
jgi:hypothetical protein